MRRHSSDIFAQDANQQPLTWFDYAVEWVLGACLIFTPLAFGTTEAWSQQIFYAAVAVVAALVTARLVTVRGSRLVFTWAFVPMVLYLLVVAISVIPLPAGVVKVISPGTVQQKAQLLGDLSNASELLANVTISFNVWSTQYGLRIVLALSVVFAAVVQTYRTNAQIKRLLITIVVSGAVVTLLALAQDFTVTKGQPQRIYWDLPFSIEALHPNSGPFVGHAQIGQFLNLCIGAMLAVILVRMSETFHGEEMSPLDLIRRAGEPGMRVVFVLLALMVAAASAIAIALTRGAMVSMAGATVLVTLLFLYKRGWRSNESPAVLLTLGVLATVVGVVYVFVEHKLERTINSAGMGMQMRALILRAVPPMVATWPVMGTGQETFEWVYPMFNKNEINHAGTFTHAENDYAQIFTDTGLLGGLLVLAFVVLVLREGVRSLRAREPIHFATLGIAFSVLAIMIHSSMDFAQRTPAIGLVTASLLGLLVVLGKRAQSEKAVSASSAPPNFTWKPWPRAVGGLIVLSACVWSVWSINDVRAAESLCWESDPSAFNLDADPTAPDYDQQLIAYYDERIAGNIDALQLDPQAVPYIYWLNHFRWRKLTRQRDPETGAVIYPQDAATEAQKIAESLSAARVLCPNYGHFYSLTGKVQWDLLNDKEKGLRNIETSFRLLPNDPETAFFLAEIAAEQGRWDDAATWAEKCFSLDRTFSNHLTNLLVRRYEKPHLAYELYKNDEGHLPRLSKELGDQPEHAALQEIISQRLWELTKARTDQYPTQAGNWAALAQASVRLGKNDEAVRAYRKAVTLDYTNLSWRMSLARLHRDMGQIDEAIKELETCLLIRPQMNEARAMQTALTKGR